KALHRPVLAVGAVQGVPDDVGAALGHELGQVGPRLPVDADAVAPALLQRREHALAGLERHLALAAEAPHQDSDAHLLQSSPMTFPSSWSSTPCWSRTVSRAISMSASRSAARAPPVLTNQLA